MSVIDNLLPQEIINKVKKLRAYFQQSLLSWIRNSDEHSRQTMHKVLQQISQLLCNYNDDNQQLNPVNSLENDFAEDNNLENKEMIEENISNQEDIVEENEFDESNDIIDKSDGFAKTIQNDKNELSFSIDQNNKVDSELTNTQILYINNSDNSYIDDRGLPQLVVTKEIDSKKVSNAYMQQQLTDQQKLLELQKEEEQYLLEEKQERTIEILKVVLVILVIVNLLLLAYFIYLRVL